MQLFTVFTFLIIALFSNLPLFAEEAVPVDPLQVTRITPEGKDVPASRQLVINFNKEVVPLGRMDRKKDEVPVAIVPELNCEWRWVNQSALACNLSEDDTMKRSTEYSVEVKAGLTAFDGSTLKESFKHSFSTEVVSVNNSWFVTWRSPGRPVINLAFNQPVAIESVQKVARFKVNDNEVDALVGVPEFDHSKVEKDGKVFHRVLQLEPKDELPLDTYVILNLSSGIVSSEGSLISEEEIDATEFQTFPELKFLGVRCENNQSEEVYYKVGKKNQDKCNPLRPIYLRFSAPVMRSQVRDFVSFTPQLGPKEKRDEVWGDLSEEYSRLDRGHSEGTTYDVYLPYGLKANQTYNVSVKLPEDNFYNSFFSTVNWFLGKPSIANTLQDEFGRPLSTDFSINFITNERNPNFELNYSSAVLEKETDSEVPFYVTNLDNVKFHFRRVSNEGLKIDQSHEFSPASDVRNIQYAMPLGVRKMLQGDSGALFGSVQTTPEVQGKWEDARKLFAQVTPWQVHAKVGHFSSLVWVTDMQTGEAVADANITFYQGQLSELNLPNAATTLATAKTDSTGLAFLPGTETIDPNLTLMRGYGAERDLILIRVDKQGDMALVPLNWDFNIDTWRASNEDIYSIQKRKLGHIRTWGATAQGIYRAGDTIDYKIYVRGQNDRSFISPPTEGYKLEILNPLNNVVSTTEDVKLNNFGAVHGSFIIPDNAPVGWYRFKLTGNFPSIDPAIDQYTREDNYSWIPLQVLVSDFTPSPFKVTASLNGDLFTAGDQVLVQSSAKLHSGGPYADAMARVTASFQPLTFAPKEGVAKGFQFAVLEDASMRQIHQSSANINAQGELETKLNIDFDDFIYGKLSVESAVRDDRGKYVASLTSADIVARDRFVGLRNTEWIYNVNKDSAVEYVVVDPRGKAVEGSKVDIVFEEQVTKSAKVKSAGNAYLTQYTSEWVKVSDCSGVSSLEPLKCSFVPPRAGYYRATATILDTKGKTSTSSEYMWVSGSDYVNWHNESDVLLTIVPEKSEYSVGETARYLIKNPWPNAKALVTVERFGIIDSFQVTLEGSTPVIEVPIKPDYIPGFYLSVVVTSPRASDAPIEGELDLGKPAFRMGYLTVPVKDPYKQIAVDIKTDKEVYRPRDLVQVDLKSKFVGDAKGEPIEFAVAVLDEAVFDLVQGGLKAYDPYQGFYTLEGLDLENYNLLIRLIGRQKFEKKGANSGGDGGSDFSMRDLFKYVSYWNPSLLADSKGQASFSFNLPDNLTGWRVLVMAVTPTDRLGLGHSNFKVNRPTEVRPVMPNQVIEGDEFKAGFSVMNRTDKTRTLTVDLNVKGELASDSKSVASEKITVEPYKRQIIYMPVKTKALPLSSNLKNSELVFTAKAYDSEDADGVEHKLKVLKYRSVETVASYDALEGQSKTKKIEIPKDIYPDIGGLSLNLSPKVISAVDGAFSYMRDYPYLCWEQVLSKGVMASHYKNLKAYVKDDFIWEGSNDLPQQTLDKAASFQAPNGGMSYYVASDSYVDPYLSAYTASVFSWLKDAGYKIPEAVESKLHSYLINLLKSDSFPSYYSEGMKSSVRAVALSALSLTGKISVDEVLRHRKEAKGMGLFGKAHLLTASLGFKESSDLANELVTMILAQSDQTAGKFIFSEQLDDGYERILTSPTRENCVVLDALTKYIKTSKPKNIDNDIPFKLVRTISEARKRRDYWQNTQENMFCMNALVSYSKSYESAPVNMNIATKFGSDIFGNASFINKKDKAITLERSMTEGDVGLKTDLIIEKSGTGMLYFNTKLQYALKNDDRQGINSGIEVKREYSVNRDNKWVLLKENDSVKRGELIRSDIYLSIPAARNYVVVDDPLPGGVEPVNTDLLTASTVDSNNANTFADDAWYLKHNDWIHYNESRWSFYHRELRHDRVVFYSDYLPAGNYHLSYSVQVIAEGSFKHGAVHAEEMYEPDVYGKGKQGRLNVEAP